MYKQSNKKGFTLVEILAAIVILGILTGVAIVSVSYILSKSKAGFYKNLENQLILAAKSYYADHRTLLPQNIGQKRQVNLETLIKNNYLKRGDVVDYGKSECDTDSSYIKVIKSSNKDYIYTIFLQCPSYSVDDQKKIQDIKATVTITGEDEISNSKAIINMSVDEEINRIASYQYIIYKNDKLIYASNNISGNDQASIIKNISLKKYVPGAIKFVLTVYDIYGNVKSVSASSSLYDKGLPKCGVQSPALSLKDNNKWINASSKDTSRVISMTCNNSITKCLASKFTRTFTDDASESYVTILGKNNEEVNCPVVVMIDKTKPICGTKNDSTTWTNGTRTVSVKCSDTTSECVKSSYSETFNDNNTKNKVVKTKNVTIKDNAGNTNTCSMNVYVDKQAPTCTVSGGSTNWIKGSRTVTVSCNDGNGSGCKVSTFSDTVSTTTKTKTYTVEDNAGNKGTCTANIYVDNTAPTTPTSGSIGSVSGSNPNANIKTAAGGSKDSHSGFSHYLYMVTNTSSAPDRNDSGFKSSMAYTRACGKSYYAWAIAVDKVGNRSAVKSLGNTKDGANSYGSWSSCSKSCGGGTQTRTNTCALVTTGLSRSCNTSSCKPATPTISNPTNGNWVNYNFALTVKTTTASSSIGYWQYKYAATNWTTYKNSATNNFKTTDFSAERNELVYIRVCTMSGECSDSASTYIRIDKTKPTLWYELKNDITGANHASGTWSRNGLYRYLYPNDNASGVKLVQYNDGGGWYTEPNLNAFWLGQMNRTSQYRVLDNAGNYSDVLTLRFMIDWTPPVYTSVAPYCGDPWGNGSRNFVRLYFSDTLSGLGMRYTDAWDSHQHSYFPDANFGGARDGVDTLANADRWLGFNHKICDVAGNCNSWNDPNVRFSSCW